MTTAGGRDIVKYMVKCALPAGDSLTKQDQNGITYTFPGGIGVAPGAQERPVRRRLPGARQRLHARPRQQLAA